MRALIKMVNKILNSDMCQRQYSDWKKLKRFYKDVSIAQNDECWFEVILDQKKLKTPMGQLFCVPNEALAVAVATEWDSQENIVRRHTMHLTSLCNTAIDNPLHRSKEDYVHSILHVLDTDTLLFRSEEPEALVEHQNMYWDPILDSVQNRYNVEIPITTSIVHGPCLSPQCKEVFWAHFMSYNFWSTVGICQAADQVKSILLTLTALDRSVTCEQAVKLSLLETIFQTDRWGSVEWAHDVQHYELQARFSAAILFTHLASESSTTKAKMLLEGPQGSSASVASSVA